MTPLFACLPVCMTFIGLALVAVVVVAMDLTNRAAVAKQSEDEGAPAAQGKTGPPPWWVMVLMVVAIAVTMVVLAWYWPE